MLTLWTIGHSNIPFETFLERLQAHEITLVADVRRYPASRRHPHFGGARLAAALRGAGIEYVHFPELGGHREPRADSPHTAWREDAFRGYADHMGTQEFQAAVDRLLARASTERLAVMCAELRWTECHRSLLADFLKAAGHQVVHITGKGTEEHPYTTAARIVEGRLSYTGLI
jgi:uncharacterized protein (DUF488 family)